MRFTAFIPLFISALLLLFSCFRTQNYLEPDRPFYHAGYATTLPAHGDTLKVVTWNIRYGEKYREAAEAFRRIPELRRADIVLLQEMNEQATDTLAQILKLNYVYFPATVHPQKHRNFGNAILSPWPLDHAHKLLLPYQAPVGHTRRIAVSAVVRMDTLSVLVYCIHTATLLTASEKRLAQADSLLKTIPDSYRHVVIGGDFNTVFSGTRDKLTRLFRQNGFRSATSKVGTTARFLFLKSQLDHIFVKGFRVVAAGTVQEHRVSDHDPVWVLLTPSFPVN